MPVTTTRFSVLLSEPIATIAPALHGQFTEHLGELVYPGLWVGPDSDVPNVDGLRSDVLAALAPLEIPVLRWPGGCFADDYHWRDGIGPREDRPQRLNAMNNALIEAMKKAYPDAGLGIALEIGAKVNKGEMKW